ncbi:TolC family protein [Salinigranum halophilum]|jgi:hypothetical protein|uniref:hypothetical protein n=1 Tax=Salinigranum halophilum TaxID=2565931 RepID=UPI00115CEA0C|nr:hypothetical protein [Salinigranum halophilum]
MTDETNRPEFSTGEEAQIREPETTLGGIRTYLPLYTSPRIRQLKTKIDISKLELERLDKQIREGRADTRALPDVEACRSHLDVAYRSIGASEEPTEEISGGEDIVSAYQALFAAKRELLHLRWFAFVEPSTSSNAGEGVKSSQDFVRQEATKLLTRAENELSGWAFYVIVRMLTADGSQLREHLEISTVIEARQVYDEQTLRQIELADILERQYSLFMNAAGASALAVVALAVVSPYLASLVSWLSGWFVGFASGNELLGLFGGLTLQYGPVFYVAVALFGLLGASISGLLTLRGTAPSARVPVVTIDLRMLAWARLYTGVGAALVLVTLVESGLPDLVFSFPVDVSNAPTALLLAFVAGFSERLLTRTMFTVSGEDSESDVESLLRYERQAEEHRPRADKTPTE